MEFSERGLRLSGDFGKCFEQNLPSLFWTFLLPSVDDRVSMGTQLSSKIVEVTLDGPCLCSGNGRSLVNAKSVSVPEWHQISLNVLRSIVPCACSAQRARSERFIENSPPSS